MFPFVYDPAWYQAFWLARPALPRGRRGPGLVARTAERLVRVLETKPDDVSWRYPPF